MQSESYNDRISPRRTKHNQWYKKLLYVEHSDSSDYKLEFSDLNFMSLAQLPEDFNAVMMLLTSLDLLHRRCRFFQSHLEPLQEQGY